MDRIVALTLLASLLLLMGCQEKVEQRVEPVRGLKTVVVKDTENLSVRRYPTVLQSSDITVLSFEIAGRLGQNPLEVGQQVKQGDALVALERRALELSVDSAKASLEQAEATAANAKSDLARQEALFTKKIVSLATIEQARTTDKTSAALEVQARKQLESAQDKLNKSILKAPYDGIIKSVAVDGFVTIDAGQTIATLYNPDSFEARFSVSYSMVTRLAVGKEAVIRLADNPGIQLKAYISELGSSADTVSSYPVVVSLADTHSSLKSGMAVEAVLEVKISEDIGHALPISALIVEGDFDFGDPSVRAVSGEVYVFDEPTHTVKRAQVTLVGLSENQMIVSEGIKPGDRVAVAGVAFLREGQKVKLLDDSSSERGQ